MKSNFDILYNIVLIGLVITLTVLLYYLKNLSLTPFLFALFIKYGLYSRQNESGNKT